MRRDAARNRRRILDAAGEVFAEHGLRARLDEIARHAGVGVGTVYRHFDGRDALVAALFEDQLDQVVDVGRKALEQPDPWHGFEYLMNEMVEVHARSRGVRELLFGAELGESEALLARGHQRIEPVFGEVVRRAQAAGALRADLQPQDLPLLQVMIGGIADYTRPIAPEAYRRLVGIVMDGLRASREAPTPLAVPAVTDDQVRWVLAGPKVGDVSR